METHLNLYNIQSRYSDILYAPNQYRIRMKTHLNLHNIHSIDAQNQ